MKLKKEELKSVLKPVIEECVKEMIAEKGFLSSIINEVHASTGNRAIVQESRNQEYKKNEADFIRQKTQKTSQALIEHKKKLMDAVGKDSFNGVNIFEGVQPIEAQKESKTSSVPSPLETLDPANTGGVNIDRIPGMGRWASVLKGVDKLKD